MKSEIKCFREYVAGKYYGCKYCLVIAKRGGKLTLDEIRGTAQSENRKSGDNFDLLSLDALLPCTFESFAEKIGFRGDEPVSDRVVLYSSDDLGEG